MVHPLRKQQKRQVSRDFTSEKRRKGVQNLYQSRIRLAVTKKVDESVTINIGMMEYVDKFPKPIRGQSLPLKVLKSDVCFKILDAAISKRKVYAISTSIHL